MRKIIGMYAENNAMKAKNNFVMSMGETAKNIHYYPKI